MKYSDAKDPNRIKEEDIFFNFISFIESIEEKKIETEFYDPVSKSIDEFEKPGPSCQVSTCERTITFPVIKKYIEESSFSGAFIDDIANSPGFTMA